MNLWSSNLSSNKLMWSARDRMSQVTAVPDLEIAFRSLGPIFITCTCKGVDDMLSNLVAKFESKFRSNFLTD